MSLQLPISEAQENDSESFLTKITEKDTKHSDSDPEVFCKVDILEKFARSTGKHLFRSLILNKVTS